MIYQIGQKFYIKVQGYYREVEAKLDGDNLEFAPKANGEEIEVYGFQEVVKPIDMKTDKDEVIKSLKKDDNEIIKSSRSMTRLGNRNKEENSRYKSRI